MAHFDKPLTVTKIDDRRWIVEKEFKYFIGKDEVEHVHVPKGFITDFASVPQPFWNLIPPDGGYTQAAVLHDFLYFIKYFERKKCDQVFLEAMRVLNCGWWKSQIMYSAVRTFGWIGWNRKREDQPNIKRYNKSNDQKSGSPK